MLKQYKLKDYNFRLVLWLCSLSAIGVLLVGSADASLELRQLGGVILGLTVMLILSLVDFSWILNFYWLIYAGNIVLLLTVILSSFGRNAKGATRWLTIFGFSFQPVELSKILLILFFAKYFMEHENDLNRFTTVLRSILLIGLPLVLIAMQPDLKNTLTVLAVFCILYYVAGISYRYIAGVVLLVVPLAVIFMVIVTQPNSGILREYQRERIMAFLNPDNDEYSEDVIQQNNSVTAIGSAFLIQWNDPKEEVASPGAMDNATGCALAYTVTEYFRDHPEKMPKNCRIISMCTGSEEAGLRGSMAFAKEHKGEDILKNAWNINIDSIADEGYFEVVIKDDWQFTRFDKDLEQMFRDTFKELNIESVKGPAIHNPVGGCDSTPMTRAGIKSVTFAAQNPVLTYYYHTFRDRPERFTPETVGKGFEVILGVIDKIGKFQEEHGYNGVNH